MFKYFFQYFLQNLFNLFLIFYKFFHMSFIFLQSFIQIFCSWTFCRSKFCYISFACRYFVFEKIYNFHFILSNVIWASRDTISKLKDLNVLFESLRTWMAPRAKFKLRWCILLLKLNQLWWPIRMICRINKNLFQIHIDLLVNMKSLNTYQSHLKVDSSPFLPHIYLDYFFINYETRT